MKKAIFLISLLSLLSCQETEQEASLPDSTLKEINEIVASIIIDDSLMVLKSENHTRMFCDSLIKLDVYIPEKQKKGGVPIPPAPSFHSISINSLLNSKITAVPIFTTKDSLFLIQQYTGIQKLAIAKTLSKKINITSKHLEINKKETGKSYNYYEMTIPVFSSDFKKAHVLLNHYCGRLCGSGRSIQLEKKQEKWVIVGQWRTWIS